MKLTKPRIKQLIKEELRTVLQEQSFRRPVKDESKFKDDDELPERLPTQADPCGQKPPLPKNWQSIKKGQPGWNERLAFRKWYICKKKGRKGAPAAQQQPQQQQQGQQGPIKLISDGLDGMMNILFNPQEWTKATGLRQDRTRQLVQKVMNPFILKMRQGQNEFNKQQQTKGQ